LAYAGLFKAGVELCGEAPASWPGLLPFAGGGLAAIAGFFLNCRRRRTVA
jgi:hypothetical protein